MTRKLRFPKPPKRESAPKRRIARKVKPRRERKTPLATLKRKLWAAVSAYVKARDGNVCFVCGAPGLIGSNWHAAHLFNAGSNGVIRYHPRNIHSCCGKCNVWLRGNIAVYAARFLDVYGIEVFRDLDARRRTIKTWTRPEIEAMLKALAQGGAAYELFYEQTYGTAREKTA